MSTDDRLDDTFVHELRTALRSGEEEVPATLLPSLAKRYGRRIALRRAGLTAVPVVLALTVGVVGLRPGSAPPDAGQASSSSAPVPNVDITLVAREVTTALDGVDGWVVHRTTTEESGKYGKPGRPAVYDNHSLGDGTAFRSSVLVGGKPVMDTSIEPDGATTSVDHVNRTWRRTPGYHSPGEAVADTDVLTPTQIKRALADGRLRVVAQGESVNGKPTVHLEGDLGLKATPPVGLWVDVDTWLPVRQQHLQDGAPPADLEWLPPTPENLGKLLAPVPDGFTEAR
ncbi:hypothetical protein AB0K14_02030 [Actinosynnema sp. NPDC050801]|uniref:hypothetical protein n=1 Tax=unclassified Actinosynnema TaxID=2637065 RepID=UPI0033C9E68D